ncbi:MAG: CRISPR-associated protein Csx16 [Pseudohongiellaceae bacterium]
MNYLITRHPGTFEWLKQKITEPSICLDHLDNLSVIGRGDTVIGTLPINLVAEVCRQGARYLHLEIDLPHHLRGQELTTQQLTELGVELVEYHAHRLIPDEDMLRPAADQESW